MKRGADCWELRMLGGPELAESALKVRPGMKVMFMSWQEARGSFAA